MLDEIVGILSDLADFYPTHIYKEDKTFFYPVMDCFSEQEQRQMLEDFWEFDRKMIHEKYRKVLDSLEKYSA